MDYTTLAKVAYECNIHLQENGPNLAALVTMSKKVFFDHVSFYMQWDYIFGYLGYTWDAICKS